MALSGIAVQRADDGYSRRGNVGGLLLLNVTCRCTQKELKRKRVVEERNKSREEEAQRLRKLEEEQAILEEKEREQMRREMEKMDGLEKEKIRRLEDQQRRLTEAMQRAEEERERRVLEETHRLAREEEERQKKRCRQAMRKETEAALMRQNRWYFEGGGTDWQEDRRRSAGKLSSDKDPSHEVASGELTQFSGVAPINPADQQDATDIDPSLPSGRMCSQRQTTKSSMNSQTTSTAAKSGRLAKRHQKKSTCKPEVVITPDVPRPDHLSAAEVAEDLVTSVLTTMETQVAEN